MTGLAGDAATVVGFGGRPAPRQVPRILSWRPWRNEAGTVVGFLDAQLPSGLVINGMKLMRGQNGTPWIAMPATRRDVADGGKPAWDPIVEFASREVRDRFTQALLEALRASHPDAFDDGGEP